MSKMDPTLPEIRAFLVRQRIAFEAAAQELRDIAKSDSKDSRLDAALREHIKTVALMVRSVARVLDGLVLVEIEARFKAIPPVPEEDED